MLLTCHNLGHLCMIPSFGRKAIMEHTGQLKKILYLCKQPGNLQHKSLCSCTVLSVASEVSIVSWFQKCCQLLILSPALCRIGAYEGRLLLLWIRKKYLGTSEDKTSKQFEPDSKFIDISEFLSLDFYKFWIKL